MTNPTTGSAGSSAEDAAVSEDGFLSRWSKRKQTSPDAETATAAELEVESCPQGVTDAASDSDRGAGDDAAEDVSAGAEPLIDPDTTAGEVVAVDAAPANAVVANTDADAVDDACLLYTSPSPRD